MAPRAVRLAAAALAVAVALGAPASGVAPAAADPAVPVPVPAAAVAADLAALQAQLIAVTAHAADLAAQLEASRAHDGGLRRAAEDLEQSRDDARRRLDAEVREAYIRALPQGLSGWARLAGRAVGDQLSDPGAALARRGTAGQVRIEQDLVDAAAGRSAQAQAVRARAERYRAGLVQQATAVLAEQDRARTLLSQAQLAVLLEQQEQARARAVAAQAERTRLALAARAAQLARQQAALDAVSATVTAALTPVQTDRGRRAAADAEPVLRLLAATGSGYPAGYRPGGAVVTGTASWYGPGFVGSPTASGRPYDPERLSCAHKSLPLGTVLHVMTSDRSVNCLVDDRGPYVGDRVLDLSRAGSRALGYDGTAEVVAEVLVRTG